MPLDGKGGKKAEKVLSLYEKRDRMALRKKKRKKKARLRKKKKEVEDGFQTKYGRQSLRPGQGNKEMSFKKCW